MGLALDAARTFYSLFEKGDLDAAVALFAPDCITVEPTGRRNPQEWRAFAQVFKDGLPDARMEIDAAVEGADSVAIRARFLGTHTGTLVMPQGALPPSGATSASGSLTFSPWPTAPSRSIRCTGT